MSITVSDSEVLKIKPSLIWFTIYWINLFAVSMLGICLGVLWLVTKIFAIPMEYVTIVIVIIILTIVSIVLIQFLREYVFISWEIEEEKIVIRKGVISRAIDFVELYRVVDYEVKTNIVYDMFNIYNLFIYSGDRNTPSLLLYGIDEHKDILEIIRRRVELCKKKRGVYEITNRP